MSDDPVERALRALRDSYEERHLRLWNSFPMDNDVRALIRDILIAAAGIGGSEGGKDA